MTNNKIKIKATNNNLVFKDVVSVDDAKTYQIDFSAWADDNHNISSVVWSTESGDAAISGEALSSNVASALITFGSVGKNLIKVKGTTASSEVYVVWIEILAKDPTLDFVDDYGFRIR